MKVNAEGCNAANVSYISCSCLHAAPVCYGIYRKTAPLSVCCTKTLIMLRTDVWYGTS